MQLLLKQTWRVVENDKSVVSQCKILLYVITRSVVTAVVTVAQYTKCTHFKEKNNIPFSYTVRFMRQ